MAAALGQVAMAAARLRGAAAAWDAHDETASIHAAQCERELAATFNDGAAANSDDVEAAFTARAAALEAAAEVAHAKAREMQGVEASARAIAAQSHSAVGLFQGVGAGVARGAHVHSHDGGA